MFHCRRFQLHESPPIKPAKRSKKCTILWWNINCLLIFFNRTYNVTDIIQDSGVLLCVVLSVSYCWWQSMSWSSECLNAAFSSMLWLSFKQELSQLWKLMCVVLTIFFILYVLYDSLIPKYLLIFKDVRILWNCKSNLNLTFYFFLFYSSLMNTYSNTSFYFEMKVMNLFQHEKLHYVCTLFIALEQL